MLVLVTTISVCQISCLYQKVHNSAAHRMTEQIAGLCCDSDNSQSVVIISYLYGKVLLACLCWSFFKTIMLMQFTSVKIYTKWLPYDTEEKNTELYGAVLFIARSHYVETAEPRGFKLYVTKNWGKGAKKGIDKELVWKAISGKESILYRQWKCSYLLVLGCKIILTDGVNFILVQLQNVVEVKPLFCKNLWTVGLNQYTYIRLQIVNGNISSKILLFDTTCAENSLKSVYWWIGAYIPGCKTGS